MGAIEEAKQGGLRYGKICEMLGMSLRRLEKWKEKGQEEPQEEAGRKRETKPYNALTHEEKEAVKEIVADSKHADESTRGLSVRLMEERKLYVSHVSIWEYERSIQANGLRGHRRNQGKRPEKPDVAFATGPNQLWGWDITKLRTTTAYVFFYLVAILDVWSRKVVGWFIDDRETSETVQRAWDLALVNENLTQVDPEKLPKSLSDRGSQMRSISTKQFFKTLGIDQLFARPRTPNDNAWTESLFSTVKMAPSYPGFFHLIQEAVAYFKVFFPWYNQEHLHTSLEMMTPEDWHSGRYVQIRDERKRIKEATFAKRRAQNLGIDSIKNKTKNAIFLD